MRIMQSGALNKHGRCSVQMLDQTISFTPDPAEFDQGQVAIVLGIATNNDEVMKITQPRGDGFV